MAGHGRAFWLPLGLMYNKLRQFICIMFNPFAAVRDALFNALGDFKVYDDLMAQSRAMPTKANAKLRVIGAGYPRTGTLSMYAAMHELGMKSYHGIELAAYPTINERWFGVLQHDLKYGSTEGIDWTKIMEGYEATFDGPACNYWLQLTRAFPDAKVIYTHREADTWVNSYIDVLRKPMTHNYWYAWGVVWFPAFRNMYKTAVLAEKKMDRDFGGPRAELIQERLEMVKKHVREERLLVFHPSQGWGPLCNFLNVPVPDKPFPRVNDGPSLVWVFQAITIIGISFWMAALAVSYKAFSRAYNMWR